MVYVSLVELLPQASQAMAELVGERTGGWIATACFFGGIGISALIDSLVPEPDNPHEPTSLLDIARAKAGQAGDPAEQNRPALARVGLLSALVIGIHNFPEGMATFASGLAEVTCRAP